MSVLRQGQPQTHCLPPTLASQVLVLQVRATMINFIFAEFQISYPSYAASHFNVVRHDTVFYFINKLLFIIQNSKTMHISSI